MALTDKQRLFCAEYMIDLNASQAAIRAGYSPKTAGAIGFENLKKPEIAEYISQLQEAKSKKLGVTFERILEHLSYIAFGDVKNYFDEHDRLILLNNLPDEVSSTIKSVTVQQEKSVVMGEVNIESTVKKIEANDKLKAFDLINKMLGHYQKDNEQRKQDSQVTIFQLPDNGR